MPPSCPAPVRDWKCWPCLCSCVCTECSVGKTARTHIMLHPVRDTQRSHRRPLLRGGGRAGGWPAACMAALMAALGVCVLAAEEQGSRAARSLLKVPLQRRDWVAKDVVSFLSFIDDFAVAPPFVDEPAKQATSLQLTNWGNVRGWHGAQAVGHVLTRPRGADAVLWHSRHWHAASRVQGAVRHRCVPSAGARGCVRVPCWC